MLRPGDKVWITPNPGGELHPAIVIRVSADRKHALVLSGTGTGPRDIPHEVVDPILRANKALQLSKKTYFYEKAVRVRAIADITPDKNPVTPRCPLALWVKLQTLALAGARAALSAKDFREWWPEVEEPATKKDVP